MSEELIQTIITIYSKYPDTQINFTEGKFLIGGLHKDRILLELQYFVKEHGKDIIN